MTLKNRIHAKLSSLLRPAFIDVVDESHLHKGHAGYRSGEGSHFHVTLIADQFEDLARIARHKLVYEALVDEMKTIHALRLTLRAPTEHE